MAGEIGYLTLNNEKNLLESVYTEAFYESAKNQPECVRHDDLVDIVKALRSVSEVTAPQSIILGGELTQNKRFSETLITQAKSLLSNTTIKTSHSPEAASLHGATHAAHELALISLGLLDEQSASSYLGFYSMSFIEESA